VYAGGGHFCNRADAIAILLLLGSQERRACTYILCDSSSHPPEAIHEYNMPSCSEINTCIAIPRPSIVIVADYRLANLNYILWQVKDNAQIDLIWMKCGHDASPQQQMRFVYLLNGRAANTT
jgi:hypothetical protein